MGLPAGFNRPIMNFMNAPALTEPDVAQRLFHPTLLLRNADYAALEQVGKPLHRYRQVTPLSEGMAISPLMHLALQNLNQPSINRFSALRTGIRRLASPGLMAGEGPFTELGLVSVATHASLSDHQMTHALSARKNWFDALVQHGVDGNALWTCIFQTLTHFRTHPRRWKSMHGGSHLRLIDKWNEWSRDHLKNATVSWSDSWPQPTLDTQMALIEDLFLKGQLDVVSVQDHGWGKLTWLAELTPNPEAVADRLALVIPKGLAEYQRQRDQQGPAHLHFSQFLDDEDLCAAYTVLTRRLGTWQDLPWETDGLAEALPQCQARYRRQGLAAQAGFQVTPSTGVRRLRMRS